MSGEPRNVQVFAAGPTGTGKSTALWHWFTARTPRVVSIDYVGEALTLDPAAIQVYGWPDTRDALRECATHRRWHIATHLEGADLARLFAVLAPPLTGADVVGYSRAIGGVAVACGEAALLAPRGRTPDEIKGVAQRGRHALLSLHLATQQPTDVDPAVRSNAHVLLATRTHETLYLDWWKRKTSAAIADAIAALPPYHVAYIVPSTGTAYLCGADRRPYRTLAFTGAAAVA